jgi:hypothetical protein
MVKIAKKSVLDKSQHCKNNFYVFYLTWKKFYIILKIRHFFENRMWTNYFKIIVHLLTENFQLLFLITIEKKIKIICHDVWYDNVDSWLIINIPWPDCQSIHVSQNLAWRIKIVHHLQIDVEQNEKVF